MADRPRLVADLGQELLLPGGHHAGCAPLPQGPAGGAHRGRAHRCLGAVERGGEGHGQEPPAGPGHLPAALLHLRARRARARHHDAERDGRAGRLRALPGGLEAAALKRLRAAGPGHDALDLRGGVPAALVPACGPGGRPDSACPGREHGGNPQSCGVQDQGRRETPQRGAEGEGAGERAPRGQRWQRAAAAAEFCGCHLLVRIRRSGRWAGRPCCSSGRSRRMGVRPRSRCGAGCKEPLRARVVPSCRAKGAGPCRSRPCSRRGPPTAPGCAALRGA
mmetsp:Transcript_44094/g.138147  ORF Transcript_44094/g.138147 Transcript_44094/m.138147 type:complete len:278 (+) Transcript_44094:610-1443(+)